MTVTVRRAILPVLLALAAASTGAVATAQERAARETGVAVGGGRLSTPVLSVRRMPMVLAEPVADRRLSADLAAWAAMLPTPACATVVDPDDAVVLAHRADEAFVPASTSKLLTAAAALEVLGSEHRFRTIVRGAPPVEGVVAGDLHLLGGGDPVLATADYAARYQRQPQVHTDLDRLAEAVQATGVRRVEGAVVGDEGRYDRQRYVAGWPARYLDQHVTGPLSALSVNDGFAEYPTSDTWRPLVPAEDPAAHAAALLTVLLEARGVEVQGAPRSGTAPAEVPEMAVVESEPLSEVLRQLLQESDNSTAELLVKELGAGVGDPSTGGGLGQVREALARLGLPMDGVDLRDGSGLSTDNRLTCGVLTGVLRLPEIGGALLDRLAVAGESGTLEEAFPDTSLEGALAAKTGSLNAVAALAGSVTDDDGSFLFSFVANDPDGRIDEAAVVAAQAALGQILLGWPQIPDLGALGPRPPAGG